MFEGASKRPPVIFATGERFAILRRKRPLRDKAGALILPLISIMRTDISQKPERGMGPGQGGPHVIKKKLSKDDPRYQRLLNKRGIKNQPGIYRPVFCHFFLRVDPFSQAPGYHRPTRCRREAHHGVLDDRTHFLALW